MDPDKTLWELFEKWLDSPEGQKAINDAGGDTKMTNPFSNACHASLAGYAYLAGFNKALLMQLQRGSCQGCHSDD